MSDKIEIDRAVPIPPEAKSVRRYYKYPIAEMKVGDSFAVGRELEKSIRSVVTRYRKLHPEMDFIVHRHVDGNVRVWRTK